MKRKLTICGSMVLVFGATSLLYSQEYRGNVGLGVFSGAHKLIGGNQDAAMVGGWGGVNLFYGLSNRVVLNANVAAGWTYARDENNHFKQTTQAPLKYFRTWLFPIELNFTLITRSAATFRPYLTAGAGVVAWQLRYERWKSDLFSPSGWNVEGTQYNLSGNIGLGSHIALSNHLLIDLGGRYRYLYDQNIDNIGTGYIGFTAGGRSNGAIQKVNEGDRNDWILEFRLGLKWLFGGPGDRDKDGIIDKLDADPDAAEDIDGFQDQDGKPDPDNDQDGIPDIRDKSPNEAEDLDGFEDEDGVPDLDNDNDGIPDIRDKSPNEPEDMDGFEDEDGVPDPDNDQDGIPDERDDCPNKPETFNGYLDEDGCPDELPKKEEPILKKGVTLVFPGVTFESSSANLTTPAKLILDDVFQMLWDHQEVVVEIRGYTDNTGTKAINQRVSQQRAQAVKNYLISKGIDANRMVAIGFGEEKPIANNSTREGRAKNRRIEFVRIR